MKASPSIQSQVLSSRRLLIPFCFWFAFGIFGVNSVAIQARAQAVYGSVFGTVTDNTGALVPNAKVTVTDVSKGISVTTQTNSSGEYRVDHLIPDTYSVQVTAPGFQTSTASGVLVYADTSPKVDIKLQVGAETSTVQVTAGQPLLQTARADVSTILNPR